MPAIVDGEPSPDVVATLNQLVGATNAIRRKRGVHTVTEPFALWPGAVELLRAEIENEGGDRMRGARVVCAIVDEMGGYADENFLKMLLKYAD